MSFSGLPTPPINLPNFPGGIPTPNFPGQQRDDDGKYSMLIAGATGAVGRELVALAVNSPHIHRIVGLTRQVIGVQQWPVVFPGINVPLAQGKLTMVTVNWEELAVNNQALAEVQLKWISQKEGDMDLSSAPNPIPEGPLRQHFGGHDIIVQAMGTTQSEAGSDEKFRRCDYEYTRAFIFGAVQCNGNIGQQLGAKVNSIKAPKPTGIIGALGKLGGGGGRGRGGGMAPPAGGMPGPGVGAIGAQLGGVLGVVGVVAAGVGQAVSGATSAVSAALSHVGGPSIRHFAQVSYEGADPAAFFLYPKTKGETDAFLQSHFSSQAVRSKSIFRPGTLLRGKKARFSEKFYANCCCCCWGGGMPVETLADAILKNAIQNCLHPPELPKPPPTPQRAAPPMPGPGGIPLGAIAGALPDTPLDLKRTLARVDCFGDDGIKRLASSPAAGYGGGQHAAGAGAPTAGGGGGNNTQPAYGQQPYAGGGATTVPATPATTTAPPPAAPANQGYPGGGGATSTPQQHQQQPQGAAYQQQAPLSRTETESPPTAEDLQPPPAPAGYPGGDQV